MVNQLDFPLKDGDVFDPIDSHDLWLAFGSPIVQANTEFKYADEARKFANEQIAKLKSESPEAMSGIREFFGDKNAVVRSFEASRGRGIAGVITSLSFDYAASTFETNRIGSRAPKFMTVSLSFTAIHDIAPGLDSSGMLRAPTHNVGKTLQGAFGDVYTDNLQKAEAIRKENLSRGTAKEKPAEAQMQSMSDAMSSSGNTPLKAT